MLHPFASGDLFPVRCFADYDQAAGPNIRCSDEEIMRQILDTARGAYSRLPPRTRARLGGLFRLVPESLKWGGTYKEWRAKIAAAHRDPGAARLQQDRSRLAVITAAVNHSRYYNELLRSRFGDVEPDQLLVSEQWSRIPILSSADVAAHAAEMCTRTVAELDVASTGGTSGRPVKFYLDRHRSPIEYAFVHDAWSRAGYRPGDPRCVLRGVELDRSEPPHMQYDQALAELRCSVFHLTDGAMRGYYDAIRARGIRYIHGYPSAIAVFAAFLQRSGLAPFTQIEGVFATSERLYASQSELLRQVFDRATLVPFYGLSEKAAFACGSSDETDVFVFDPLYGFTELVDAEGAPVTAPGTRGRIVSTGLLFQGMPFIRYDTGDTAELVALPDAENSYRLTVRGITPKHATEYFLGRSGALIAVKGIISNLQGTAYGIREYQFYQDTPGQAEVRVVPLSPEVADFTAYRDLLARKVAGELRMSVVVVDRIPLTQRGKRKLIDQRLDLTRTADALLTQAMPEAALAD
jgi:phenylacetate-CoA ligase